MSDDPKAFPWDCYGIEFEITGVRIVATLGSDGGAIVENLRRLYCIEGRHYSFEGTSGKWLHSLDYNFGFSAVTEAEPLPSKAVSGRIVITGHHTNGQRMEIRGTGWIGYDEGGNVEGRFDTPPVIITDDVDPDDDDNEEEARREPGSILDFPMPPQFVQATVRVPPNEWDLLDDE